uniref:Uncharacterized protein n=1 Tax=Strombidium rassoulzadegani TaxID=1082188 RepID=A0A7S3CKS0_9SPIT|mmetsp:Transcript_14849/g.25274  ORF Transcript_14849/g.25274 Transcript_14849/m.25274 type:complete len:154 (+) Transcript_14849:45-506(+)
MTEKPSGSRKNMNQVEINAQWEEAVKKENRGRVLNEHFDFNPKKLLVITDKPTSINKLNAVSSSKGKDSQESMDALKKKLEILTTIPKKKYPYPMTAAQEIGWDDDTMFQIHKPKYGFNRQTYAETWFANEYVTTFHKSPFAIEKNVVDPAKK